MSQRITINRANVTERGPPSSAFFASADSTSIHNFLLKGVFMKTEDSTIAFQDHVVVTLPFEKMMLEEPRRLELLQASDQLSDDQKAYVERVFEAADAQPCLIRCHQTMVGACGKAATRIIIPNRDGRIFVTLPRFVCDSDTCLDITLKRSKLESIVFPFSHAGLRQFMQQYDDDAAAKKFARYLARSWGLVVTGSKYNTKALVAFFGVQSKVTER